MQSFKIDDIAGIANYIKSLDIYTQFDEIIITPIFTNDPTRQRFDSIEIGIKADDQLIFVHKERRLFTDLTIRLDHYFDRDVKYLSASVLFGRKLVGSIDTFDRYSVVECVECVNLVIAENERSKYVLRVYLNDDEIAVATVSDKFKFSHDSFDSSHEFKSKSAVKIEELKDVLEKFEKLKKSISID